MSYELHLGDCLEVMKTLPANSMDSIVTDPPYMIGFMGKAFDRAKDNPAANVEVWAEALRVAKPGAMLLAFGGTRTHHRLMCAIEDAGWEIRDCLMWLYGSGFPKSMDISKAIDKAAGAEREVIGRGKKAGGASNGHNSSSVGYACTSNEFDITAPATDAARTWEGWGTALKPAWEPIILARKPLSEPTIAANVLKWGTGGINVDACRIGTDESLARPYGGGNQVYGKYNMERGTVTGAELQGRWPANLILDEEAAALLDEMSGVRPSSYRPSGKRGGHTISGMFFEERSTRSGAIEGYNDAPAGASRFFYVAKASKRDRDEGLEGMPEQPTAAYGSETIEGAAGRGRQPRHSGSSANHHPTVKPTQLMRYLVRLVTPPGGVILDPFCGSGSTLKAAVLEGFNGVGIDTEAEYLAIATKRLAAAAAQPFLLEVQP